MDGVCALENACFVHPWSRQSVESELDNPQSVFYVAVENGAVIGYIGSLYAHFGFVKVGERKDFYTEPTENAVLMTLYF